MADTTLLKEKLDNILFEKVNIESDISKLVSRLTLNKAKLNKLTSKINEANGNCYYVYIVFVNGVPKYVGKGKGDRFKHPISGASSVPELNRDFFNGD